MTAPALSAPDAGNGAGGLDLDRVRASFPALAVEDDGRRRIYLDNPAGSQVPRQVIERVGDYLTRWNANLGGEHAPSRRSDQIVDEAHRAMADFVGADSPREIVFGANMTTLTFAISRSLGHLLEPGGEVLLSRLDHDANVRPWELLAQERGLTVRWLDFDPVTGELDLSRLPDLVSERTRLAAVGLASNLLGTVNEVAAIARAVKAVGGLLYVDAVHFAPHGPIDVAALGCDLLVSSPYKYFGPHLGALWAREELLERLPPYKVRAASDALPGRFETGTQAHELLAGLLGTFDYLEELGRGVAAASGSAPRSRRAALVAAMTAVRAYERGLSSALLDGLGSVRGIRVHGASARSALARRVPTVSISAEGHAPDAIARRLAAKGVLVTAGTGYAIAAVDRIGLADRGGVVRLGCLHYNTVDEVATAMRCLEESLR